MVVFKTANRFFLARAEARAPSIYTRACACMYYIPSFCDIAIKFALKGKLGSIKYLTTLTIRLFLHT